MADLPEIHAGFPSPAADYMAGVIDLNRELVRHPEATFYGRVVGDSMADADVHEGDVLVIDKSLTPSEGDMAVCFLDGEFCLKPEIHLPPPRRPLAASRQQQIQAHPRVRGLGVLGMGRGHVCDKEASVEASLSHT